MSLDAYGSVRFCHDRDEKIEDSDGHQDLKSEKEDSLDETVGGVEDIARIKISQQYGVRRHH